MTTLSPASTASVPGNPRPGDVTMIDLTVAICAYNAASRIAMVLESLATQRTGLAWELVFVDNASTDGTGEAVRAMSERLGLPLRLVREEQPGLAMARRRAVLEARSELLSFLDDDVVVPTDWVEECTRFLRAHPACGIVGAKVVPLFEDERARPADFDHWYAGILSMFDLGDEPRLLDGPKAPKVVGAGMSGRTEVFRLAFVELPSITGGRRGSSLAGGEDLEAQLVARRVGWQIWYDPRLVLRHFVPVRKLSTQYLRKWFIDTAACHAWLHCFELFEAPPTRAELLREASRDFRWIGAALVRSCSLWMRREEREYSKFWVRQGLARIRGFWALSRRRSEMVRIYGVVAGAAARAPVREPKEGR